MYAILSDQQQRAKHLQPLRDLAAANHVKAALEEICRAEVKSTNGKVHSHVPAQRIRCAGFAGAGLKRQTRVIIQADLANEIKEVLRVVPGAKEVFCGVGCPYDW